MKILMFTSLLAVAASTKSCDKKDDCKENVKADCICTMEYDPVCGCNNKTYSNACAAQCHGITKFEKGECPN